RRPGGPGHRPGRSPPPPARPVAAIRTRPRVVHPVLPVPRAPLPPFPSVRQPKGTPAACPPGAPARTACRAAVGGLASCLMANSSAARTGRRLFGEPRVEEAGPGVHVARAFDLGNVIKIATREGPVIVDTASA